MKNTILMMTLVVAALIFVACDPAASNTGNSTANAGNKPANNSAAPAADSAAIEAEIKKLMDTAQAALAKNDADAMEKIYADNYMLVNIDGSVQNKAERVAALRSGEAKYTAFSYSDAKIRSNPEGTGAIAIVKLSMKGSNKGKPVEGDYRVTQVYSKTKDGWKQVSAQATKIEAGADASKADDKKADANANKPANK